ncbi:MAG: glycosyltransferase family 2 protein [Acidimicrobiales bacterium]|nr:glycosyltransferase family 2 protein [Acidimicrobiales bacterium]
MKLLIAIPALDEEDSIESIIERTLAARSTIIERSPVTEVAVTVVSDGSTDRTVERASRHLEQVDLIVFEQNQGYGAAIKAAWSASDAELLGFLDADGTCDPVFFADLCATLDERDVDVVLGSRMSATSKMPLVRRVGNRIFAGLLRAVSSEDVSDTASGMRVVRRSSLAKLYPLPDGLHFTPAMSARVLLDDDLHLVEIEMPYDEREGESKLSAVSDGGRFLWVILRTAALYRPARLLGPPAALCLAVATLLMVGPTLYYLENQRLQEWMIYRFLVSSLLVTAALLLASGAYLTARIVDVTLMPQVVRTGVRPAVRRVSASRWFWAVPAALFLLGGLLVLPSFLQLVRTGATYEHWSRFIAMTTLYSVALILIVVRVIDSFLVLVDERLTQRREAEARQPPPEAEPHLVGAAG